MGVSLLLQGFIKLFLEFHQLDESFVNDAGLVFITLQNNERTWC